MSKTYEHTCPLCDGDGRYEVVDFRRLTSASEEPPLMWRSCEKCRGEGVVHVDETSEGVIAGLIEDHRRERLADSIIIEAQRQQIRTLQALLKSERDLAAALERRAS